LAESREIDALFVFLDIGFLLENTSVFQSQVGDQLIALRRMGYTAGLLASARDRAIFDRVIGQRLRDAGVEVWLVDQTNFPQLLLRLSAALRRLTVTRHVRRAYVRGIWGAAAIALAGRRHKLPYVYDLRGSLADEMRAVGSSAPKRAFYEGLERWCIAGADRVSAVTRALADTVARAHHRERVCVVPCCIDPPLMTVPAEAAARRRQELGFAPDDCVLVYSGGLSFYQQVPAMLTIWRRLRDDPAIRFLLLTNEDPHAAPMFVGDLSVFGDRLLHLSLPRSEIALTLASADLGFMLRDSRELNRVASPVKFPEYLCAGLAVVASPGTGDASGLIEQHQVGTLVDPGDIDGGVEAVRAMIRRWRAEPSGFKNRARELVRIHYDWHAHAGTFQELYGAPSGEAPLKT
jgi:glycosyltransferase involved in cell wall biosynthesis